MNDNNILARIITGASYSEWQPIYFGLFSFVVVANVIVALYLSGCPQCPDWQAVVVESGTDGIVKGTVLVSIIEVLRIMIILPADYLRYKFIEPLKQSLVDEGREQERQAAAEWYAKQQEAAEKGEPFDEPPPWERDD